MFKSDDQKSFDPAVLVTWQIEKAYDKYHNEWYAQFTGRSMKNTGVLIVTLFIAQYVVNQAVKYHQITLISREVF